HRPAPGPGGPAGTRPPPLRNSARWSPSSPGMFDARNPDSFRSPAKNRNIRSNGQAHPVLVGPYEVEPFRGFGRVDLRDPGHGGDGADADAPEPAGGQPGLPGGGAGGTAGPPPGGGGPPAVPAGGGDRPHRCPPAAAGRAGGGAGAAGSGNPADRRGARTGGGRGGGPSQ